MSGTANELTRNVIENLVDELVDKIKRIPHLPLERLVGRHFMLDQTHCNGYRPHFLFVNWASTPYLAMKFGLPRIHESELSGRIVRGGITQGGKVTNDASGFFRVDFTLADPRFSDQVLFVVHEYLRFTAEKFDEAIEFDMQQLATIRRKYKQMKEALND